MNDPEEEKKVLDAIAGNQKYHSILKFQQYVVRGSVLSCQYGTKYARMDIKEDYGVYKSDLAVMTCAECNTSNIHSFGSCLCPESKYAGRVPMNPSVDKNVNKAIRQGGNKYAHICVPYIVSGWKQFDKVTMIEIGLEGYAPMLTDAAVLICQYSGIISVEEVVENKNSASMLVTREQLIECGWIASTISDSMLKELNEVLVKYQIDTENRISHFIAQCLHESLKGMYVFEQGSEEYFSTKKYTSKYRGVGYIQMTWDYSYMAFATYLCLNEYPELSQYTAYKSPNNNSSEVIKKQYEKLINGAKERGIDIKVYTDIVDIGYEYASPKFAWECAGYDWEVKQLNSIIDGGGTVDDVSRKINRWDEQTFPKRKAFYDEIKSKKVFSD